MKTGRFFAVVVVGWVMLSGISFGYSGGTGDPNNPYQIADANNLLELAGDPNNYNKNFILTADIDLEGRTFTKAIIAPDTRNSNGSNYLSTPFTGMLDGGGYKITHFSIDGGSNRYLGLIGFIGSGGRVIKLGVENYTIDGTSSQFVGGLTGYNYYGTISQCYSNGSISLTGYSSESIYAGGLIGTNYYGTVNDCYAAGAISINNATGFAVGGFIGSNSNGIVSDCYTTCSLSINSYYYTPDAGGFIGRNLINSSVTRCFWDIQAAGSAVCGITYDYTSYPYFSDVRGRSTDQMKDINIFLLAGWDFVFETDNGTQDIWFKSSGQYPCLAWQTDTPPQLATVPEVISMEKTDAQNAITTAGLELWTTNVYSDTVAPGTVVNQNPAAGTILPAEVKVNVQVSIGSYTGPGSGTETDPYKIGTAAEWQSFMYTSANWNKYFILIADIDFWNIPLGPIGNSSKAFTGSFDGNGHIVCNIINSGGLFGMIRGARVRNLTVLNAMVGGYDSVGGLVSSNSGYISNCYFDGIVSGYSKVGGLVGQNILSMKESEGGYIAKCHTSGDVIGNTDVGGLVGYNYSTVKDCYSSATVTGWTEVGGLTGFGGGFSNCYATGNVTGITRVGGLSGYGGAISNSYSTGAVVGRSYVGGLAGYLGGDLTNTYSIGHVSSTISTNYIGGLAGFKSSGVVTGSFWDMETSGQTTSAAGTGKTTAEMKTISTFTSAGWDFTPNWIDGDWQDWVLESEGVDYPRLNCQFPSAYHGGQGTVEEPYQIADVNDILALSESWWDWDQQNFIVTNDIDLKGIQFSRAVIAPDTSSGILFQGTSFRGKFDGCGHKITNLTITGADNSYLGLFGYLSSFYYSIETYRSEIKNLILENFSVSGYSYVGGLLGYDFYGDISNCYVNGSTAGSSYVGGLAGYSLFGNISTSHAKSTVSGTSYIGGLAGAVSYSSINTCSSNSSVTGSDHVGGLTGSGGSNISHSCSISTVTGFSYIGGLTGSGGNLTNCYSMGMAVARPGTSSGQYVGGLAGYSAGDITNCYAASVVCGYANTGGMVGYKSSDTGVITNSFWDMEISGITTSAGGTGRTTAQMKTLSTYLDSGWDFSDTDGDAADWRMPNGDYPRLTWQPTMAVPDITGISFKNAASKALLAGFSIGDFNLVYDGTMPTGTILNQSPPAGTFTVGGAAIDYAISFAGWQGEGTSDNPYQITSTVDLLALANDPNIYNKYFILTHNLDLEGLTFDTAVIAPDANSVSEFQGTAFTGIFDGNGRTISHLAIQTGGNGYLGLFGFIDSGGQVMNLGLEDIRIEGYYGSNYVGGLAGFNNSGTIRGCYSIGDISCNVRIGGLVGGNKGIVSNSYSLGTVGGYNYIGGLTGENNSSTIVNCYSTCFVSAYSSEYSRGGLVGYNYNAAVQSSFWDIQTSGLSSSAVGTGKTTAEMKTLSTFTSVGWDFVGETVNGTSDIWKMRCEGMNYPKLSWQEIPSGDFACPDGVSTEDLDYFVGQWLLNNCTSANNYCGGADGDGSGSVDLADYAVLAGHWMEGI